MTLSTQTVRKIGTVSGIVRFTGLPLIGYGSTVAVEFDEYPSSRAVRRGYHPIVDPAGAYRTWIARMSTVASSGAIGNALSKTDNNVETQICDPDYVDWGSITLTGNMPRNLQGGRVRYYNNNGSVSVDDGVNPPSVVGSAYETRQALLVGNVLVEANKLAPLFGESFYGGSVAWSNDGTGANDLYSVRLLLTDSDSFTLVERRLNGTADETAWSRSGVLIFGDDTDPANVVDIYIANVDPGTLIADTSTATLAGSIIPGTTDSFHITDAIFTSASIPRWNHYVLYAIASGTGIISAGTNISAYFFSPIDVPPPYNCPGVDGMLMGGYYA